MANDDPGQALHDRATRGLPLTAEEQAHLDDWYATCDRDEFIAMPGNGDLETLESLQSQVRTGAQQILVAAQRIQLLTEQNDTLRREIIALQQRLAHLPAAYPA